MAFLKFFILPKAVNSALSLLTLVWCCCRSAFVSRMYPSVLSRVTSVKSVVRMVLGFVLLGVPCLAGSIRIDCTQDYAVLDRFFRTMFLCEEYGYVLEGIKPISLRNFPALNCFPITQNFQYNKEEFDRALLVREALSVWKKFSSRSKCFVLKSVQLAGNASSSIEVCFINIPKLQEVVEKSIDLFHYVLGPNQTSQQIVNSLVYSDRPLVENLKHDLTLVGIVLGFGAHNSVVGGRRETIGAFSISKDHPPFTPQSCLMQNAADHSLDFLTPERYGMYYLELAGGDDSYFRIDLPRLQPNSPFSCIVEEVQFLDKLQDPLPPCLWQQPKFVFGAFKGGLSNEFFFKELQKTQKQILNFLKKPDFLECVLEKICGERPLIRTEQIQRVSVKPTPTVETWTEIIWNAINQLDCKEKKVAFTQAFCYPMDSFRKPPFMMGASAAALKGLTIARRNLMKANSKFETFSHNHSLTAVVPQRLYFTINSPGNGQELKGEDRVRIGYVIEDLDGNVLFANYDCWLRPSQTIAGLAHGIQGMHIQEKRTLFIHPAFAYGALTSLPPCSGLVINVHLLELNEAILYRFLLWSPSMLVG